MFNKIPRSLLIRLLIVAILAVVSAVFFWRYINSYLTRSKASGTVITLSLIPASLSLNTGETKEVQLVAQFTGGSDTEKIDYTKIKINFPKDNIELAGDIGTFSGLSRQMRVDGPTAANDSGQIVIEIGAASPGAGPATNSDPVTIAHMNFKGISSVSNGNITIDTAEIFNNAAAAITDVTKNNTIVNVSGTSAPTATPTPLPGATATPTASGSVTLNLKLKFQGITKKPVTNTMSVRIKLGGIPPVTDYQTGTFTANDSGVWSGTVSFNTVPGPAYIVYVKGPKHIQKKICAATPTETSPGSYHCSTGTITLAAGANNLDFSGVYLLAGDLPDQDGVVNSYDTSLVRNNLGKNDANSLRLADVNLDGVVDSQDFSLIISALSVRGDEE